MSVIEFLRIYGSNGHSVSHLLQPYFRSIFPVHGGSEDMLYGSDGKSIALTKLKEIFEAEKCPALKNKPKIFILQCCRGRDKELARPEGRGDASGSHTRYGTYGYCKMLQCKLPNVRFGELLTNFFDVSIFVIHKFCLTSRYTTEG